MKTVMRFFEEIEDVDFKLKLYTSLTGAWLLINFIAQLPLYLSLWGGADNIILSRELHGPRLPMLLDLLTHYPLLSPFVYILVIFFSVLMIMGKTNIAIRIATWYLVFLLDAKAWTVLDGGNNLIHLTLFYSILFDYRFGSPETQRFVRNLGIRAIQVQLVLVYACAFFSKVGGELWQNGTALYYVVQVDKFQSASLMSLFQKFPITVPLMVYGTILIQLILATFLWIKNWRLVAIALGIMVHLGIAASMGLIAFSLVMIVHYSMFISQDEVLKVKEIIQRHWKLAVSLPVVLFISNLAITSKSSEYFSSEVLTAMMKNLKPGSKLFVMKSGAEAEIIESNSVQMLNHWKNLELEYGSITKLVTALKIFEEEKKGTLNRNDSVELQKGKNATLDELMFHTSGVRDLGPDKFIFGENKEVSYSNANYAFAGQYLKLKAGNSSSDAHQYVPKQSNPGGLINASRRPLINDFYKSAFGIVGSAEELSKILKNPEIAQLPCREDGKCWGGFRKGNRFISIGKLESGTTLGSVDREGNVIIISSNDHTIDLEKILEMVE